MNYSESRTAEEICESSSKMITFIDLAGHHKYLKTTIFGLTSYCPDFAMLVVSANTGIGDLQRRHTARLLTASCCFYFFPLTDLNDIKNIYLFSDFFLYLRLICAVLLLQIVVPPF